MRIAVIGASGKAGSLIANEAWSRGHEVTAVARRANSVDTDRYGVIVRDLFDLREEDAEDFEVVVNAFNSPPGQEHQHKTSVLKLIEVFENLPETRLLFVGGAGSLYTDASRTKMAVSMIPEEFAAVPRNMLEGFRMLRQSKVNWTFMSPAFFFDPNGPRTGRYTLGTDYLFNNRAGQSYLSFADAAVAMVDEIEKPQFIGRRFTLVSESGPRTDPEEMPVTEGPPRKHGRQP
ncbi:MAG: NAD(P)H-binding protein [Clostridiales bacterium]|jgi:putative NADH-flavin reductase|nr:NAD(P)H-binding protein [Clostridiales bacterium]